MQSWRLAAILGGGVAVAIAVVALLAAGVFSSAPTSRRGAIRVHVVSSTSTTSTTVVHHVVPAPNPHLCPLTGEPAPGGQVPARPAIGVKIGNDPYSRPQTGLQHADIVYEEMAEGGITRYLAIFQCQQAPVIGPVRSVRFDDWHVLASYGHPILAFSGGINEWNRVVASLKWLYDANGSFYPQANAYYRTSNKPAPWNYYTSTSALWKLDPTEHTPPPVQFHYQPAPPASAIPMAGVTIVNFAAGSNVVWRWDAAANQWERYYGSQPDLNAAGVQQHATNVVVQVVTTRLGPYPESGTTTDTISNLVGHGVAYVFRNGKVEEGTWTNPKNGDVTQFRLRDGSTMTFEPGNTWVELVPTSYTVQLNP